MIHSAITKLTLTAFALALMAGCHPIQQRGHHFEAGYSDAGKTQVIFYAPPGATVMMADQFMGIVSPDRSHQVAMNGDNKLEVSPEELAVFNLAPGSYPFKYTAAEWSDASVYGEVEICPVWCPVSPAKDLLRQSAIPIALPAPNTLEAASAKDDLYPYQSPAHRLKISYQDVERLTAGDMVTKVVFIADLKKAKERLNDIERDLVKLRGERQRLQAMLNQAHMDALENPSSGRFIRLEVRLKALDQKVLEKQDEQTRLTALVQADNVWTRREMVVLATDEILPKHEDPVASARKLGQVVLIMRIGGRHQHWGFPAQEADEAVR
jgi:hypothetical protein